MGKYKRALVTGGAGFIGSNISKALLAQGLKVTIIDNLSMGKAENIPEGATFIKGDILDESLLKEIIPSVDIIFHEAAKVSIRESVKQFYDDANNNLMGTLNLLKSCCNSSVKKFVYASSMAVYADSETCIPINEDYIKEPISPYGISKLASEKYCLNIANEIGMDCIILRYFNTYGQGQTLTPYVGVITIFINNILHGKPPIIFGSGNQKRDFIYVGDVVQANLKAMEWSGSKGIFNIGTGEPKSVNEIAGILCKKMNPDLKPVYEQEKQGELKNSIADLTKAKKDLGYYPSEKFEEKIDEVITWWKNKKT
ncbi:MAG: NAD-dependent epimerase/dehydratase family protein [Candidatus Schekmanbacteria bacterium]|nr:NAD-dependent epimerase/dehydratase family protein [Candidatus Schekmanbacteria bacterium]